MGGINRRPCIIHGANAFNIRYHIRYGSHALTHGVNTSNIWPHSRSQ